MHRTCNCDPETSPFHWQTALPRSIFNGRAFNYGAAAGGRGRSEISAENRVRFQERTGHDLGEVLSAKVVQTERGVTG